MVFVVGDRVGGVTVVEVAVCVVAEELGPVPIADSRCVCSDGCEVLNPEQVRSCRNAELTISAYRDLRREARQWLLLDATYVVGTLVEPEPIPDEVAEAWRRFLVTQVEQLPAAFGFLADDTSGAGNRTPLEAGRATSRRTPCRCPAPNSGAIRGLRSRPRVCWSGWVVSRRFERVGRS